MKKKLNKNTKITKKFLKKPNKIISTVYNLLYFTSFFAIHQRYFLHTQQFHHMNFNKLKLRYYCILSGRSRSIYRFFNLSRLKLKEYGQAGYFVGFSKAS